MAGHELQTRLNVAKRKKPQKKSIYEDREEGSPNFSESMSISSWFSIATIPSSSDT
jgi:hypothetical protein